MVEPRARAAIVFAGYAIQPSRTVLVYRKLINGGIVDIVIRSELAASTLVLRYNYRGSAIAPISVDCPGLTACTLARYAPSTRIVCAELKTGAGRDTGRSRRRHPHLSEPRGFNQNRDKNCCKDSPHETSKFCFRHGMLSSPRCALYACPATAASSAGKTTCLSPPPHCLVAVSPHPPNVRRFPSRG